MFAEDSKRAADPSDETEATEEVTHRALKYTERDHCMNLATDGVEGLWAATVFYVNDGSY